MELNDQKLNVLLTLYKQQQSTAHILRERMSKIAAAMISLLVAIDGWVFAKHIQFGVQQRGLLIVSILVLIGISIYGLRSRFNEFSAVGRMIVQIESAMKIYQSGYYLDQQSLYPEAFQHLGEPGYEHGRNILNSYIYMLLALAVLSIGIVVLA